MLSIAIMLIIDGYQTTQLYEDGIQSDLFAYRHLSVEKRNIQHSLRSRCSDVDSRLDYFLDANYVVSLIGRLKEYDEIAANISNFIERFYYKFLRGNGYKFMIVMPAADRSLLDVVMKETPDDNVKKMLLRSVAEAIQYLHGKRLLHGDIKALNIVRANENDIRLIDLDASLKLDSDYAGAKFSSGVLPPEMFAVLSKSEKTEFENHFKGVDKNLWTKVEPVRDSERDCFYVVRAFDSRKGIANMMENGNFLRKGTAAIDIWAFGVLMYYMLSVGNQNLFTVDNNDDLSNVKDFREMIHMTDDTMVNRIRRCVQEPLAADLLMQILKINPLERLPFKNILVSYTLLFKF